MNELVRAFLENEQDLRLVMWLGGDGFGEVWEVESSSGVRSAIKVSLDPLDGENPAVKKELENLNLIKALSGHPHIVGLLDYWLVSGFLVTRWELATEGSLSDVLETYRKDGQTGIPPKQLVPWIYEAADGLDFLHDKGIYHRDIKPQNLLLFHGHVKLGDLGLAKLVGAGTASHTGSGTLGYLPPEAWEEHRLTPTVDLYALAATYIKLRTGHEPFGMSPLEIEGRQRQGRPVLEGLEEGEQEILLAALHPDPERRFAGECRSWVRGLWDLFSQAEEPQWRNSTDRPREPMGDPDKEDLIVGKDGIGTLEQALEECPPGGVIRLPAGVYRLRGPLEIDKPVGLVGEGPEVTRVVCEGEDFAVKVSGAKFSARGISFEHDGEKWANVMVIESAKIGIENCRFWGGVYDQENERGGEGLWVGGATTGAVKLSSFVQNGHCGIALHDTADVVLEGNTCEDNQWSGIGYFDTAGGTARKNVCRNNGLNGIDVQGRATPTLERNICEENDESGIAYFDDAGGMARNNLCRNNRLNGIPVANQAAPTLEGNTCEGNDQSGIAYFDAAGGTARNNVCRNNGLDGIEVQGRAAPTLEGNICEENDESGIAYFDTAGGTARGNVCRSNRENQIWLGKTAQPTLVDNEGNAKRQQPFWVTVKELAARVIKRWLLPASD